MYYIGVLWGADLEADGKRLDDVPGQRQGDLHLKAPSKRSYSYCLKRRKFLQLLVLVIQPYFQNSLAATAQAQSPDSTGIRVETRAACPSGQGFVLEERSWPRFRVGDASLTVDWENTQSLLIPVRR